MTCGKSERELWAENRRIRWNLNSAEGDEIERTRAAWDAARAAWKAHLSDPLAVSLSKDHRGRFEVHMNDGGIACYRVAGDIRSETVLSATAEQIWDGERRVRDDDPDAKAAYDVAMVEGLPRLVDELRRQRDELG